MTSESLSGESSLEAPAANRKSGRRSPDYEKGRERGGVPSSQPPHIPSTREALVAGERVMIDLPVDP